MNLHGQKMKSIKRIIIVDDDENEDQTQNQIQKLILTDQQMSKKIQIMIKKQRRNKIAHKMIHKTKINQKLQLHKIINEINEVILHQMNFRKHITLLIHMELLQKNQLKARK
jgi:hypothetical protein